MRIAFVMDDVGVSSNGTSATARRYANELRRQGHEVRLVGIGADGPGACPVAERPIPVVTPVSHRNGFRFAEADKGAVARAVGDVDVVHLFLPFALEQEALAQARAARVPVSAAFHLQPENVTYNAGIGAAPAVCDLIYRLFRSWLYDGVRHVHCPSAMIAGQLAHHGYTSETTVISNGVPALFSPGPDPAPLLGDGPVDVVTVGRLAQEKNQATVIEAVARSRHRDRIRLHVCGQGPKGHRLRGLAQRLGVDARFGLLDPPDLVALLRRCPLYVHASVADIEAMAVLEAMACGCVPVIGRAPMSAPAAFALTDESLFPAKDPAALAERLDWWIERPGEVARWRRRYLEEAESLAIARCCEAFVDFEERAIFDDRAAYGDAVRSHVAPGTPSRP